MVSSAFAQPPESRAAAPARSAAPKKPRAWDMGDLRAAPCRAARRIPRGGRGGPSRRRRLLRRPAPLLVLRHRRLVLGQHPPDEVLRDRRGALGLLDPPDP